MMYTWVLRVQRVSLHPVWYEGYPVIKACSRSSMVTSYLDELTSLMDEFNFNKANHVGFAQKSRKCHAQ